jgi:hypothetical protein
MVMQMWQRRVPLERDEMRDRSIDFGCDARPIR